MSSPVAPQEGQETAEGAEYEPTHGKVKRAILRRLAELYPEKRIPWGEYMAAAEGFNYAYFAEVARKAGYSYREEPIERAYRKGEVRKFIENEISMKYPCMVVPRGVAGEWADKLGISRQRAHQIVNNYGAKAQRPVKSTRTCKDCDEPALPKRHRCAEHLEVRLTCESCGKEFYLPRGDVFARAKQSDAQAKKPTARKGGGYGALTLCRKDCRKQRGIAYMRANPGMNTAIVAEKFGVSRGAVEHWKNYMFHGQTLGLEVGEPAWR